MHCLHSAQLHLKLSVVGARERSWFRVSNHKERGERDQRQGRDVGQGCEAMWIRGGAWGQVHLGFNTSEKSDLEHGG